MNRLALNAALFALMGAVAAGANAQTTPMPAPTIYGLLDASFGRFQALNSPYQKAVESGSMSTSFLGLRGSDDLGGGLRARYGLESYLRLDTGSAGRFPSAQDAFWARTAYVGFQGAFGSSLLGRLPTPLWTATRLFNPFGDSTGFSPSIRQYFGGALNGVVGDSRWNNSILFSSPEPEGGHGLSYSVQVNAGENSVGTTGKNIGASALYVSGPLSATGVWQEVRNGVTPLPPGFDHQTTLQAGVSYEFPVVKIYGQAGRVKTSATTGHKTALYQVGGVVPVGLGFIIGSYGQAKTERLPANTTRRTASLGYDYYLSKSTDIYAVYMNEQQTILSSGNSLAAGVRLRF